MDPTRPQDGAGPKAPPPIGWLAELAFELGDLAALPPQGPGPASTAQPSPPSILPPEVLAALHGQPAPALVVEAKALPSETKPKARLGKAPSALPSLAEAAEPPGLSPGAFWAQQGQKLVGQLKAKPRPQTPSQAAPEPAALGSEGLAQAKVEGKAKEKAKGLAPEGGFSSAGNPAAGPASGQASPPSGKGGVKLYGPGQGPTLGAPGSPSQATWVFDPLYGWRLRPKLGSARGFRVASEERGPSMPLLDPSQGPEAGPWLPPGEVASTRVEVGVVGDLDWAKELLNTMGAIDTGSLPAIDPEAIAGPKLDDLRALLKQLPPQPPGFSLEQVPKDFHAFDALLRRRVESPTRRLAAEVVGLPVVEAAFELWDPRQPERNRRVLNEVYGRIVGLLGGLLRFQPAPLAWPSQMRPGAYGFYNFGEHVVVLSSGLLQLPIQEALATLVHEQAHALQGEWIARLGLPNRPATLREKRTLSHEERALALYWLWEFPRIEAFHQGHTKPKSPEEAHRMYRRFGLEHHAFYSEKLVVEACNEAYRSGAAWEGRLQHEPVQAALGLLKG